MTSLERPLPLNVVVVLLAAALIVLVFVLFAMFAKFYRKIQQGHALIVNTMRAEPTVTFTGCMVYPVIHKAELMEISVKTIEIDRSGREGLICKDNIRADITVAFYIRVDATEESVRRVAQMLTPDETTGLSGHSMRIGAAQDMMAAGIDHIAIMHAGGWKSINVLARYVENASVGHIHALFQKFLSHRLGFLGVHCIHRGQHSYIHELTAHVRNEGDLFPIHFIDRFT